MYARAVAPVTVDSQYRAATEGAALLDRSQAGKLALSGPGAIEFLDSVSLKKLVDEQIAKGVSIEEHPVKRAISTQPVVKPIKITAPNSVFALGAAFSK